MLLDGQEGQSLRKNKSKDQLKNIRSLEECVRTGRYRQALRVYLGALGIDSASDAMVSATDSHIRLLYAIALQHAGLFEVALRMYQYVAAEMRTAGKVEQDRPIGSSDLVYNARVQEAVLLERLGQPREALRILQKIGSPDNHSDANLAMASMPSWVDITKLRCALALRDRTALLTIARKCSRNGDWNQKIWGRLFLALAPVMGAKLRAAQVRAVKNDVKALLAEMDQVDPPATPWLALIAGQELAREYPRAAEDLLTTAHEQATEFGKFFVIAAACEELSSCYLRTRRRDDSERILLRALNAYSRCGVLMLEPFTRRLFLLASKLWGKSFATSSFLRSAHLLQRRNDLVFSQMCEWHAKEQDKRPDEVFEDFVRDWALARYIGQYRHLEAGRETADALVVRNGRGTAIQAKHVRTPRSHIPKRLYLRKLSEIFGVQIDRYVFVATTSSPVGWRESLWHAQYTERLRQLIPDPNIKVDVVLEPELQTDVVLNDELFEKYFQGNK